MVDVAVVGAGGTMGTMIRALLERTEGFRVSAAIGSRDALTTMDDADVVIDVTLPQVSPKVVEHAVAAGLPVVVGTSGWSAERVQTLRSAVDRRGGAGVLVVPNFSIGSVLATRLAEIAAVHFDSIEIVEAHHAGKIDSPSGTAVRTAERIGAVRAELGPVAAPHSDQRARGQLVASVPVHSLRLQGVVAKQTVHLGGIGEVLRIEHETVSQAAYEAGVLLALRAVPLLEGVVVGLDHVLFGDAAGSEHPTDGVADEPSGQAARATSA